MDSLTHVLAGAALGRAFYKDKLGAAAMPTLMLASNLPDIDGLSVFLPMEATITLRRTFGHSLFLLPLWCLGLAWLLRRRYKDQDLGALFRACLAACAVHLFLDLVNSFGVLLLWPFSPWRPELAGVFIVDLFLSGCLALPWLWRTPRAFRAGWLAAALYLGLCLGLRQRAVGILAQMRQGPPTDFAYVFPEPFGPHRWRGVIRQGRQYRIFLIHSLSGKIEERGSVETQNDEPAVLKARAGALGRRLEAFFKAPVWQTRPEGGVRVFDLRFRSLLWRRQGVFEYTLPP